MENSSKENTRTIEPDCCNDKLRDMMVLASQAIAIQRLTPRDCFKKALSELKYAKKYTDKEHPDKYIDEAIKYIELGIEKC